MFSKSCPKSSESSFYLKSDVFIEPKKSPNIWANIKETLTQSIFKNLTIWSDWAVNISVGSSIVEGGKEPCEVHDQCDQKKSPNFYKSCPNLISLEKL